MAPTNGRELHAPSPPLAAHKLLMIQTYHYSACEGCCHDQFVAPEYMENFRVYRSQEPGCNKSGINDTDIPLFRTWGPLSWSMWGSLRLAPSSCYKLSFIQPPPAKTPCNLCLLQDNPPSALLELSNPTHPPPGINFLTPPQLWTVEQMLSENTGTSNTAMRNFTILYRSQWHLTRHRQQL